MQLNNEYEKAKDLYYEKFLKFPLMEWGFIDEDYHTRKFIDLMYKAIKEDDPTIAENTKKLDPDVVY